MFLINPFFFTLGRVLRVYQRRRQCFSLLRGNKEINFVLPLWFNNKMHLNMVGIVLKFERLGLKCQITVLQDYFWFYILSTETMKLDL